MKKKPIVIDLFCGAGGESQGIHWALGDDITLFAVNHWEKACQTHSVNFPHDECICQDIQTVNPCKLVPDGHVDLLWASPECTHFSRARGDRPMSDQSRCTPFDILRYASMLSIDNIIVENVPEFVQWGILGKNNRPIESGKGKLFQSFVSMFKAMGYKVDWKILNAADFGAPTSRKRFFLQASKKGIVWATATHSKDGDMFCEKWKPVKEVINWNIPKQPLSTRKKPLCEVTIKNIFNGIQKFQSKNKDKPFIEPLIYGYYGNATLTSISQPCPTLTCMNKFALVEPICNKNKVIDLSLRMLSVDELKQVQSFPKSYKFIGNYTDQVKQIGNAVVPKIAEALIKAAMCKTA